MSPIAEKKMAWAGLEINIVAILIIAVEIHKMLCGNAKKKAR